MAQEPCYMKAVIRLASSSMVTSRKVGWHIRKGMSGKRVTPFVYPLQKGKKASAKFICGPDPTITTMLGGGTH